MSAGDKKLARSKEQEANRRYSLSVIGYLLLNRRKQREPRLGLLFVSFVALCERLKAGVLHARYPLRVNGKKQ